MASVENTNSQLVKPISDETLLKYGTTIFRKGYIEVTNKKFVLPQYFLEFMETIENFEVYDTDVFVVSYPRTGSTWTTEMVWCIGHDLEFSDVEIFRRFPLLDMTYSYDTSEFPKFFDKIADNSVEYVRNLPHPRYIKTHLPWDLLPKQIRTGERKPKIIYVYRNPKDTCVSFYHYIKNGKMYSGNLNIFVDLFLKGRFIFGPYPAHILSVIEQKNRENVLIINYEEMKSDLRSIIKKVIQFLGKSYSNEEISKLEKHLSFESMKNNKAVNRKQIMPNFIRKGIIGSHKDELTTELIERFDKWIIEQFVNTEIKFE